MKLYARNLRYHARSNVSVAFGAAAATAALTGALLVGDSMRASLRDHALARLGAYHYVLVAPRFFDARLIERLDADWPGAGGLERPCPAILARGGGVHAESRARVEGVSIVGVTPEFWTHANGSSDRSIGEAALDSNAVLLNEPLAGALGAAVGDEVLLRLGKPSVVSAEMLLGRRDEQSATMRLHVAGIVDTEGLGAFSLRPQQSFPMNAFVPLETLQRALDQPRGLNAILVARSSEYEVDGDGERAILDARLATNLDPADVGLTLRPDRTRGYVSLESDALVLEPPVEQAAMRAGGAVRAVVVPTLTYLANTIRVLRPEEDESASRPTNTEPMIPYSTVTAIEPGSIPFLRMRSSDSEDAVALAAGEIILNRWAADELAAKPGDRVRIEYFATAGLGELETRSADFALAGIVPLQGAADDPGFTPEYPGITDTRSMSDWDPPFPIDFRRIRSVDEEYWDQHRGTPKAFVALADGLRLWAERADSLGRFTAIRFYPREGGDVEALHEAIGGALKSALDPAPLGLRFEPVRAQHLAASRGSTDFGGLFIGFSFFLIAAAAMLAALLFRLNVERRAEEIGLLLALGIGRRAVARTLLAEGLVLAVIGSAIGLICSIAYARLMIVGLRTLWSQAANAPFLKLSITPSSLVTGFVAGIVISIVAIGWALRGLTRESVRSLLGGNAAGDKHVGSRRRGTWSVTIAATSFAGAAIVLVISVLTGFIPQTASFFIVGVLLLTGGLSLFRRLLIVEHPGAASGAVRLDLIRLAIRNLRRNPGRSMTTAALLASATFLLLSLDAFRVRPDRDRATGGFAFIAESTVPLRYGLNSPAGRDALGLSVEETALSGARVYSFRLRAGDESSCLNLYAKREPRIVGASRAFIERGGFAFAGASGNTQEERENPWLLLEGRLEDGVIPVIGDEAAVRWQLHADLGGEIVIQDERGRDVRLRFVALLAGSALQSELIVSEANFSRLFPSIDGFGFFLVETARGDAETVSQALERGLAAFGFDAQPSAERLAAFFAVQNTYISTFQLLGGFGLVLGTLGLAAVTLRNIFERRREIALLAALGYSRRALRRLVFMENSALVAAGLALGAAPALVAVAPHIPRRLDGAWWISLLQLIIVVFFTGAAAGWFALRPLTRMRVTTALRSE